MSVLFVNTRSKESRLAETEPHIAALWASSDHSPNISQGQDFGWRINPAFVVKMRHIMANRAQMQEVATRFDKSVQDLQEYDVLYYLSILDDESKMQHDKPQDYTEDYLDEIRALEKKYVDDAASGQYVHEPIAAETVAKPAAPTQESLDDLERRVQLEERLAKARATPAASVVTPELTTTTTTEAPTTTTTTTKKK